MTPISDVNSNQNVINNTEAPRVIREDRIREEIQLGADRRTIKHRINI